MDDHGVELDPPQREWLKLRMQAGLTVTDMSVRSGFARQTVRRWEDGGSSSSSAHLVRYAAALRAAVRERENIGMLKHTPEFSYSPQVKVLADRMNTLVSALELSLSGQAGDITPEETDYLIEKLWNVRRALRRHEYTLRSRNRIRKEPA